MSVMPRPSSADRQWMELAIELSRLCPPSASAYSVGAVIVDGGGRELARGYSREDDPHVHAEECALGKLGALGGPGALGEGGAPDRDLRRPDRDPRLQAATLYSTLEPCSQRRSRPRTCTELIPAAGIGRVVMAWREPSLFVAYCRGSDLLAQAGVAVDELTDLARQAQTVNAH